MPTTDDPDMLGEDPPVDDEPRRCHLREPRALFGRGDRAFGPRKRCTFNQDHDGACSWDRDDVDEDAAARVAELHKHSRAGEG